METEKRLIWDEDAQNRIAALAVKRGSDLIPMDMITYILFNESPTVDAVEVPDKKLLRAVKLLIRQYECSKQSDFVHNPIAHAFYHTWKELDESGYGERRDK